MVYITAIKQDKNYKRKVCLSDGTDFVLYKREVETFGLREDMEMTEDIYASLMEQVFIPRARRRAMHLLERMDRSEAQLRCKLKENGYPQEAIDAAIDYVASYHYIDDERLAKAHIRFYQESRSRVRITQDLMKKGISRDVIERCLEEEYTASQVDMIRFLMEKRHYHPSEATREEKAKMYRFLAQRGFSSGDINRALGECWEDS